MDIETRFLAKECTQVDLAEALAIYSKNQFLREFIRIICQDEARTLKYQMLSMAKMGEQCHAVLKKEWTETERFLSHVKFLIETEKDKEFAEFCESVPSSSEGQSNARQQSLKKSMMTSGSSANVGDDEGPALDGANAGTAAIHMAVYKMDMKNPGEEYENADMKKKEAEIKQQLEKTGKPSSFVKRAMEEQEDDIV